MSLVINQKQSRRLLEEHAKSSCNLGLLAKNELYVAIFFLLIGILISISNETNRFVGLPFMAIGIFEIIKYPNREKRWVRKKEKEKIFNKTLEFKIVNDVLKITNEKELKTHMFNDMRKCLISETGILFKISWIEYYYISFKSLSNKIKQEDLIKHLKSQFKDAKITDHRKDKEIFST